MLTEKDYCDKDLSLALKEAGYIGQGRCYYDLDKEPNKLRHFGIQVLTTRSAEALNFVLAVHLYDAQKWLREDKGMHIEINLQFLSEEKRWYWGFTIIYFDNPDLVTINGDYSSYEETLSEAIKEAVKILKNNGKAN